MSLNNIMKTLGNYANKLQKLQDFNKPIPLPNIVNPTIETNIKLAEQNNILDEQNNETKKQTEELVKQTSILDEAKVLTEKNAEYTKQLTELTIENCKSAQKQFKSSQIYSVVATIIAVLSFGIAVGTLVFGVYSSNKTEELYKTQIRNQEEIILQLKNANSVQNATKYQHNNAPIKNKPQK